MVAAGAERERRTRRRTWGDVRVREWLLSFPPRALVRSFALSARLLAYSPTTSVRSVGA
jgi:hypothetical protein